MITVIRDIVKFIGAGIDERVSRDKNERKYLQLLVAIGDRRDERDRNIQGNSIGSIYRINSNDNRYLEILERTTKFISIKVIETNRLSKRCIGQER